jgi:methyl-accepting chemotaxis protein
MALNAALLKESFEAILPTADRLASVFYDTLFRRYPALEPLFGRTGFEEQKRKLIRALRLIVLNTERPIALHAYLGGLGQIHDSYGVEPVDYPAVRECLLAALAEVSDTWGNEVEKAWAEALDHVIDLMLAGAHRPVLGRRAPMATHHPAGERLVRDDGA